MAFTQLPIESIRKINDSVFHDFLGIIPSLSKREREQFPLKDLQYAKLVSSPDKPLITVAKVLRRVYHSAGYFIGDVRKMLEDPGDRTMNDLAEFVKKNHFSIHEV